MFIGFKECHSYGVVIMRKLLITLLFVLFTTQVFAAGATRLIDPNGTAYGIEATMMNDSTVNVDGASGLTVAAQLYGRVNDGSVKGLRVDGSTHSLQVVDYEHHEIHSGSHYFWEDAEEIANGASFLTVMVTPDSTKWIHFFMEATSEGETDYKLYEGISTSSDGTGVNTYNSNRNSGNTSGMTISTGPSDAEVSAGSLITHDIIGSGKKAGGTSRDSNEIILKQNTKYLWLIDNTSGAANNVSWVFEWYEHTDKE